MSAQPNAPHLLQWTTAAVESSQRLSYWVDAVCEAFLEMECTAVDAHGFAGQLQSLPKGAISLNRVVASAQDVFRTRHAISRSVDAPFYLITDTCCEWQVRQDGETAHLRAGDAVLIDSAKPYEFHFQQGVSCLSIQIARGCLSQWLDAPEARGLRLTRHDQGWGQSLAALNRQFFGDLATANALPQDLLVDHIGALLGASLPEPERGGQAELRDLVGMARHCIGADLASSTLTAVVVAAQLGVSVRTLHRAFAQRGLSFLQCLQSQRIERAAHMLRQARLAHVLVGEIGRRCGFPDASHFVRVFQQHRGITPSHWRRQALP
jgi:AraC family transcriptional regulator, positive regulator of tynA and feaB